MDADARPKRLTRSEAKARTRERLIAAAAQVFARKGFSGASVDDIAEAAGFTTGALYAHFDSKQALFVEVLAAHRRVRMTDAASIVSEAGHDVDALRASLNDLVVAVADEDSDLAPLEAEIWLYAVRHPEVLPVLADQFVQNRDALAAVLARRGRGTGVDGPDDFGQVATVLMALFQGLVQLRRTNPELVPDSLYGDAAHWMFAGLVSLGQR